MLSLCIFAALNTHKDLPRKVGVEVDVERQLEPVALMSPELARLPTAPSLSHEWT